MLARKRPLFHSEADFQHALAWLLHEQWPQARIRLEYPFTLNEKRCYLDVFVQQGEQQLAIELKYKTRETAVDINPIMGKVYRGRYVVYAKVVHIFQEELCL